MRNHNDQQQNKNDENETSHSSNSVDSQVNHQDDDSVSYWSAGEDEASYSGPIMRSRAKNQKTTALNKANNLMASNFDAEVDAPSSSERSYWFISKNVAHAIGGQARKWSK